MQFFFYLFCFITTTLGPLALGRGFKPNGVFYAIFEVSILFVMYKALKNGRNTLTEIDAGYRMFVSLSHNDAQL